MSITVEPAEQLVFYSPFTNPSKESLYVKNSTDQTVLFKVKTTAPKQYCVRPNSGKVEPYSTVEIQIILQPFKEELAKDYKCKDKFLVQTAPLKESFGLQDMTQLWAHIEATDKQSMRQHKIRCVFSNEMEEDEKIDTPALVPESTNPAKKAELPARESSSPKQEISTTYEEGLNLALKKIERLEKEIDQLQHRTPIESIHSHLAQLENKQKIEGYPPHVLLSVALFVFFFTYLFF